MTLKHWTLALACFLVLSFCHEARSQVENTASQSQGQTVIGGQGQASAGAEQAQSQGHTAISGGGSGGAVNNSGNSGISFKDSFNGSAPIRYLPVPATIPIENYQPGIFGRADYEDKGPNFVSMRQLIGAMNMVDLDAEVQGAEDITVIQQMMVAPPKEDTKSKKDKKPADTPKKKAAVNFELNDGKAVNHGFKPIATLTVEADKPDKSNSASLAIAIGKVARELGATRVVFLTEGSSKELHSSGWGIGFSANWATVDSDPSGSGGVGSGGFGYSQGTAGYRDKIYLTAIVGN